MQVSMNGYAILSLILKHQKQPKHLSKENWVLDVVALPTMPAPGRGRQDK